MCLKGMHFVGKCIKNIFDNHPAKKDLMWHPEKFRPFQINIGSVHGNKPWSNVNQIGP